MLVRPVSQIGGDEVWTNSLLSGRVREVPGQQVQGKAKSREDWLSPGRLLPICKLKGRNQKSEAVCSETG